MSHPTSTLSQPNAPEPPSLLNAIKHVESAINDLNSLYVTLVSSLRSLEKRLDSLSTSIPALPHPSSPARSALRRRQVFLRVPDTEDLDDYDFLDLLLQSISFTHYVKFFRLPSKSPSPFPRPFILTFYSPEDAEMFINYLYKEKNKGDPQISLFLSPLIARINYEKKEDLEVHRRLWREAIQLNDQDGSRVAIVRGLTLIRLATPGEWNVQPR